MRRLSTASLTLLFLAAHLLLAAPLAVEEPLAFVTEWGSLGSGDGYLNAPIGLAVADGGNVYVADTGNNRIQVFDAEGTFLFEWGSFGTGAGQFKTPSDVAIDELGNVYVVETHNHRVQVFTSNGTRIGGWGSYGGEGGEFRYPRGIAVRDGVVYVADSAASTNRIQKFSTDGTFIKTWGGCCRADGQLYTPYCVAVAADGSVYVAEYGNHRVSKFTGDGTFVTKWGFPCPLSGSCFGGTGEGEFIHPTGIAVDADGFVYVTDSGKPAAVGGAHSDRVQKFDGDGNFVTQWGSEGDDEDQFRLPHGVATGADGLVYVSDTNNHRIQLFGPAVTSVAIAIKPPSGSTASINLKSKGLIPVAILTTSTAAGDAVDFDPLHPVDGVDPESVLFAGAAKAHKSPLGHWQDVDGDGDTDLVLHFRTQETGITCGATEALLTGETHSGKAIEGSGLIRTVGCK